MQINYVSNPEKADAVYKKTRSQYANYKVGLILIVLFLVGIAYDLYNMYLWINFGCTMDNIVLILRLQLLLVIFIVFSVFYMLSRRKETPFSKEKEHVTLFDDHLSIEYECGSKKKRKFFRNNIYYCDIRELFFEENKKRLQN